MLAHPTPPHTPPAWNPLNYLPLRAKLRGQGNTLVYSLPPQQPGERSSLGLTPLHIPSITPTPPQVVWLLPCVMPPCPRLSGSRVRGVLLNCLFQRPRPGLHRDPWAAGTEDVWDGRRRAPPARSDRLEAGTWLTHECGRTQKNSIFHF